MKNYLHHLPILNLGKPIDSIWNDSPILFWSIIVVSASKHPQHSNYFSILRSPFRLLLSDYMVSSIRSIYTVQALLILILWPFPVTKQQDDPSWEYCGMAVAAVLKLTSDDSHTNWPGSNPTFIEESVYSKTWLGCFAVSTEYVCPNVTSYFHASGSPVTVSPPLLCYHLPWAWSRKRCPYSDPRYGWICLTSF